MYIFIFTLYAWIYVSMNGIASAIKELVEVFFSQITYTGNSSFG